MRQTRHLDTEELLAVMLPERDEADNRAARHVAGCQKCRREVDHFTALRRNPRMPADRPGEAALLRVFGLLRSSAPRRAERARYAKPRLVYDSRTEPAVAGIRAPAPGRHLAWRAERADVEVSWSDEGTAGSGFLTGQVLPRGGIPGAPVGDVWLEQRGLPVEWSLLGPSGEFTLSAPRGQTWSILLRWGDLKMRLTP
jgi:hypothetical protein